MSGTRAPGAESERQAAAWVRAMFGQVAPRYDLLNHLLSLNIDRRWRRRTVERVRKALARPDGVAIDLCCGTGDLMLALNEAGPALVLGSDFCHEMLVETRRKRRGAPVFEADTLGMPLRDSSADLLTVAFGFRNLANYETGLREMRRVLRPGGMAAILEFSQPPNAWFARLYEWYSRHVLPRLGGLISGAPQAYTYLPESVRRFPGPEDLASMMRACGFSEVRWERMTFGIVALHIGRA